MSVKNVNVFLTCTRLLNSGAPGRIKPELTDSLVQKLITLYPEEPVENILIDCRKAYKVMLKKDKEENKGLEDDS